MVQQIRKTPGGALTPGEVLARHVRARRAYLGQISQGELARLVNGFGPIPEGKTERTFGWTHATVSRIELAEAEPSLSELVALAFACEVSILELLDPVVAGVEQVDLGFNEPTDAADAREYLLSGERRVHSAGTRRRGTDDDSA